MKPIWLRRGYMFLAPAPRIRNIHLVAQHIPHRARLLTGSKRLLNGHGLQRGQLLVAGKASPIGMAKHLIKQLPEFSLTHEASL